MASKPYEQLDAAYNLAGIKAMLGDRDGAMALVREVVEQGGAALIANHIEDYFASLREDDEFIQLVFGQTGRLNEDP